MSKTQYIILDLFFPDNPKIVKNSNCEPYIFDSYNDALIFATGNTRKYQIVKLDKSIY